MPAWAYVIEMLIAVLAGGYCHIYITVAAELKPSGSEAFKAATLAWFFFVVLVTIILHMGWVLRTITLGFISYDFY